VKATPAQVSATLGNLAARAGILADDLRKLQPRLSLSRRDDEAMFAVAIAGVNVTVVMCRALEAMVTARAAKKEQTS